MDTYKDLRRFLELSFLLSIYRKVLSNGWKETGEDWLKTIGYFHDKGWLYYGKERGRVVTTFGAYRIKKFEDKVPEVPEKEEGNILFIDFVVSEAEDPLLIWRMMKQYKKKHPKLKEIVYFYRDQDNKFKRLKVRRTNGKFKQTSTTSTNTSRVNRSKV